LQKTQLILTQLEGAYLGHAHLQKADLSGTKLHEAYLYDAEIQEANLNKTELQGAYLVGARLQGACLRGTHLEGTDLRESFFDTTTQLINVTLGDETVGSAKLADIHWGDTNLAVVDWLSVKVLGDESEAQKQRKNDEKDRLTLYRRAVRANRQLATVLQSQGLNEDAAHFAYHAQYMQRIVFRLQKKFGRYLGSLILDLVAGYGYRWRRAFLTYLLIVTAFATAYFIIGGIFGPALSPLSAFVFSMTSFHGRGFFPGGIGLEDPLTILAALEAFVGLLIEVTFIATLTQRLFGK
jgi:Pentapeptide repeats (8 copies)